MLHNLASLHFNPIHPMNYVLTKKGAMLTVQYWSDLFIYLYLNVHSCLKAVKSIQDGYQV